MRGRRETVSREAFDSTAKELGERRCTAFPAYLCEVKVSTCLDVWTPLALFCSLVLCALSWCLVCVPCLCTVFVCLVLCLVYVGIFCLWPVYVLNFRLVSVPRMRPGLGRTGA